MIDEAEFAVPRYLRRRGTAAPQKVTACCELYSDGNAEVPRVNHSPDWQLVAAYLQCKDLPEASFAPADLLDKMNSHARTPGSPQLRALSRSVGLTELQGWRS
jgi:hypothetical protein